MQRIVRAVPVRSKEGLIELAEGVSNWPEEERSRFLSHFGNPVEEWYFQEIDGQPYVIAVAEGSNLEEGFSRYTDLQDPFFNWFSEQVLELSGVDLRQVPTAASSELILKLSA